MMPNSRLGSEQGLTLLEVLIAMALLAFISIAIYQATVKSFDLNFRLGNEANDYSNMALSLQAVESDLGTIYTPIMETLPNKPDSPPINFWSGNVRSDGLRRARFKGDKEKVTFVANNYRRVEADSPQSEFHLVTWKIESNAGGTYSLFRCSDWNVYHYEDSSALPPNCVALIDTLSSAKFTYYRKENKTWEENWDSEGEFAKPANRFPAMISLKVEIPDPLNTAKTQQWEMIVRPLQTLNIQSQEEKEKAKQQFLN